MRQLFESALREETGADVAFMNTGGVRAVFHEGELLARSVWNAMPFEDYVVTGTVRGSQLPRSVRLPASRPSVCQLQSVPLMDVELNVISVSLSAFSTEHIGIIQPY